MYVAIHLPDFKPAWSVAFFWSNGSALYFSNFGGVCQLWSKGQWRYSHIVKLYRVMWTTWSRPTKMVLGICKLCMGVQTSCARPPGSLQWIDRWTWASEQFIALFANETEIWRWRCGVQQVCPILFKLLIGPTYRPYKLDRFCLPPSN